LSAYSPTFFAVNGEQRLLILERIGLGDHRGVTGIGVV